MWSKKQNMWSYKRPKKPCKAKKNGFRWPKRTKTLFSITVRDQTNVQDQINVQANKVLKTL